MCSSKSIHCPVRLMTQRAMEMKMMAGASVSHSSDADDDNAYEHRKSRAEMEVETDMDPEKHRQEFLARTGISTDTATFRMFIIFGTLAFTAILTIFTFDEFLLFFHTNVSPSLHWLSCCRGPAPPAGDRRRFAHKVFGTESRCEDQSHGISEGSSVFGADFFVSV